MSEEADSHARTLRQTEEHFRSRLAEMQEEKSLALEEKELHFASLIAREQSNQQGLQVSSLNSQIHVCITYSCNECFDNRMDFLILSVK